MRSAFLLTLVVSGLSCRAQPNRIAADDAAAPPSADLVELQRPPPAFDISPLPFVHPDPRLTAQVGELQAAAGSFVEVDARDLERLAPRVVADSKWRTADLLGGARPWPVASADVSPGAVHEASIEVPEILRHVFRSADDYADIVVYETKGLLLVRISGPGIPPSPLDELALNALAERVLLMRVPNFSGTPRYERDWHFVSVPGTSMPTFAAGVTFSDGRARGLGWKRRGLLRMLQGPTAR